MVHHFKRFELFLARGRAIFIFLFHVLIDSLRNGKRLKKKNKEEEGKVIWHFLNIRKCVGNKNKTIVSCPILFARGSVINKEKETYDNK